MLNNKPKNINEKVFYLSALADASYFDSVYHCNSQQGKLSFHLANKYLTHLINPSK